MLKVCESEFSNKFSIDTVGSSGTITCKFKNYTYEVGVRITLGGSGLTKIVVFTPYYMLVNKAKVTMSGFQPLLHGRLLELLGASTPQLAICSKSSYSIAISS
jgi:hypothetical protein